MAKAGLGDLTKTVDTLYTNRYLDLALRLEPAAAKRA